MMRARGMAPYLFVDDILLMGKENEGPDKFKKAMNDTLEYLTVPGTRTSPGNHIYLLLERQ